MATTVKNLLARSYPLLQTKSLPPAEADLLLAFVLGLDKAQLYSRPEAEINGEAETQFNQLLESRLEGKPIAYLTGAKEFYGRSFLVNQNVLIPRPDSEILIEQALKFLKDKAQADIIDIGTGSGCLIITIACETQQKFKYTGSDISGPALVLARKNAEQHKAPEITWLQSNLWQSIPEHTFDLIVANLPYLTAEQMEESSIKHEPELALYGGNQGLHYYKQLLTGIRNYTKLGSVILLEIDPSQEHFLDSDIKKIFPSGIIDYILDLSNKKRVIKVAT